MVKLPYKYKCPKCGKQYKTLVYFMRHIGDVLCSDCGIKRDFACISNLWFCKNCKKEVGFYHISRSETECYRNYTQYEIKK